MYFKHLFREDLNLLNIILHFEQLTSQERKYKLKNRFSNFIYCKKLNIKILIIKPSFMNHLPV